MRFYLTLAVICLGALTGAAGELPQGTAPSYVIDGVQVFRGADGIYRAATMGGRVTTSTIVAQLSAPVPMPASGVVARPPEPVFPTPVRSSFYNLTGAPLGGCAGGQCPTPGRR